MGADGMHESLRVPPNSGEAEQAVLGGLMLAPESLFRVMDLLTEESFYRRDHRLIYRAILDMHAARKPFDVVTLGEWFERHNLQDHIGGSAYLIEIASTTPSAANISAYADIVQEKALLRGLIEAGTDVVNQAFDARDRTALQIVGDAQVRMSRALQGAPSELESPDAAITEIIADATAADEKPVIQGLTTGLPDLDAILGGMRPGQLIVIGGRPKMGKEQPNSSMVRVPGGWTRIGSLRVGDAIFSHDGARSEVLGVYPQGTKDTFTLTFADGRTARCGIDHLWEVRCKSWVAPRVITTNELIELMPSRPGRLCVRMVSGHFEPDAELSIDPWMLGFLLGDGCFRGTVSFSTADPEIVERMAALIGDGYSLSSYGACDHRIVSPRGKTNRYRDALRAMDLFGCSSLSKFIPTEYLYASREQRMELLRGLVDSDGWVEKYGCVQIATSSHALVEDIQFLVRSLGGKCSMRRKPTKRAMSYIATLNLGPGEIPAWLPRKVARLKGGRGTQQWLTIKSIKKDAEQEECTCIRVSHPSRLYVTDDFVVTHNSTLGQNIAEHVALRLHKRVAMHSLEMSPKELLSRSICSIGEIDANRLRHNELTEAEWTAWSKVTGILKRAPLLFSRPRNVRGVQIVAQTQREHASKPIALVVVDYLQLIDVSGAANQNIGFGEVTRMLKLMAGAMGCVVILLSQLSRALESRPNKRPVLSDLRDSGSIEQDADAVVFVYRDEIYNNKSPERGTAEIIVEAQRSGRPGTARVEADLDKFRFRSLPFDWVPAPAPVDPDPKPKQTRKSGFKARGYERGHED